MSVFISYSTRDKPFVDRLALALIQANIKVWRDEWKLHPGASLTEAIRAAIDDSSFLCVVVSDHALASKWVAQEIEAGLVAEAEKKRLTIIPLRLDGSDIPAPLKDRLYVDFTSGFEDAWRKLLDVLVSGHELDGSHGLKEGADYFQLYAAEGGKKGNLPFVDFDIVSLDRQERFCVLTQMQCLGTPETAERIHDKEASFLRVWTLRSGARHFSAHPERALLTANETRFARFSLCDPEEGIEVQVRVRMKRLGTHSQTTLLFNWGALFEQICESASIAWQVPDANTEAAKASG